MKSINPLTVNIEDISVDYRFITLKHNKEFQIPRIDELFLDNFNIIAVSYSLQKIFVFDHNGEPQNVISRKGMSPDRYSLMKHVNYDSKNKQLEVLDSYLGKIFIYSLSGNFLKSLDINDHRASGYKFYKLPSGYIFDRNNQSRADKSHLAFYDKNLKHKSSFLPIPNVLLNFALIQNSNTDCVGDSAYYIPPLSTIIYSITPSGCLGKYYIDLPKQNIPSQELLNRESFLTFKDYKYYMYKNHIASRVDYLNITDDFVAFNCYADDEKGKLRSQNIVYSKRSDSTMQIGGYASKKYTDFNYPGSRIIRKGNSFAMTFSAKYFSALYKAGKRNLPPEILQNIKDNNPNPSILLFTQKTF